MYSLSLPVIDALYLKMKINEIFMKLCCSFLFLKKEQQSKLKSIEFYKKRGLPDIDKGEGLW